MYAEGSPVMQTKSVSLPRPKGMGFTPATTSTKKPKLGKVDQNARARALDLIDSQVRTMKGLHLESDPVRSAPSKIGTHLGKAPSTGTSRKPGRPTMLDALDRALGAISMDMALRGSTGEMPALPPMAIEEPPAYLL